MVPTNHESLRAGTIKVTATPRRLQAIKVACKGWSGTKYGVEITNSCWAQAITLLKAADMAPDADMGPVPKATAGKLLSGWAGA